MSDKPLQVTGTLSGMGFTADGGLRITFHTNELTEEEKVIASKYHQKFGHILFKANAFSAEDVPKNDAEDRRKTPSARLRASLFKLWKLLKEPEGDFDAWYKREMESFIERVHNQLDIIEEAGEKEEED